RPVAVCWRGATNRVLGVIFCSKAAGRRVMPPTDVRSSKGGRMLGSSWTLLARAAIGSLLLVALAAPARATGSFVEFESGQVRPLALSPDGSTLFAVNTT